MFGIKKLLTQILAKVSEDRSEDNKVKVTFTVNYVGGSEPHTYLLKELPRVGGPVFLGKYVDPQFGVGPNFIVESMKLCLNEGVHYSVELKNDSFENQKVHDRTRYSQKHKQANLI